MQSPSDSADPGGRLARLMDALRQWTETVRRAFVEFLTIPSLMIVGFLVLAAIMYALDEARIAAKGANSDPIWGGLFSDAQAMRDFLGVIASSIITVTSITLSLLLIAVQQGAASLTSLVFDQFLRRRTNQFYFGFFIGLALYALTVLTSITPFHEPIYAVAVAGVMVVVALNMLIVLIYTTIDQMRPVVIIKSIHDHTLLARKCQLDLLRNTRRSPRLEGVGSIPVAAERSGFVARLDVAAMAKAANEAEAEVVIRVSIGDYVAFGDAIAEVRLAPNGDAASLKLVIDRAIALEQQRDLDTDPAFGIDQLVTIGWTSISTAKSNPNPGLLAIWNLRDLLARWLRSDAAFGAGGAPEGDPNAPVVYSDKLPDQLLQGFEALAVVASESMQHQSIAEIYQTVASQFHRLPPHLGRKAEKLLLRSLSGLGDHILTSELAAALSAVAAALDAAGHCQSAEAISAAESRLGLSVGRLNSRSTRVEAGQAPQGSID